MLIRLIVAAALVILCVLNVEAQRRVVALTVDDLPFAPADPTNPSDAVLSKSAWNVNRKLLKALARHHVPVTGFVNGNKVQRFTTGKQILGQWMAQGLDLGNHTFSHPDFNELSVEQFEDEVIKGEASLKPLMAAAGRTQLFFRFPFNHTGDTREKHKALSDFLAARGYRQAPCTIENSDWMFSAAYGKMLARHDRAAAARLRAEYLAFTSAQIDYFAKLNRQVLGYDAPQIMLLHDNRLNADMIEPLLTLFEQKGYRWVSLTEAEADPVYQKPDTFVTKYGPMWGYRWSRELNIKVDGSLEPDPPKWMTEYGQDKPSQRRPRSAF